MGNVVLAFDGDSAGEQAMHNALLNLLPIEEDVRAFLRSWVFNKEEYTKAITFLSNEALADEYRVNVSAVSGNMPDWYRDSAREWANECMRLINYRAAELTRPDNGYDQIKEYNREHTISSVLSEFGYRAVPGRSTRCPAHDDSSPSLSISRDDGRAYCFNQSCILWHDGYGVDAFELNKILSK